MCALAGQIAAATSRFLRLLAGFDTREGWPGPGMRSCAHWLSWRAGTDLRTAREHVRVAHALTALPRTRVGGYHLDDAEDLAELTARAEDLEASMPLVPLADAAATSLAVRRLDEVQARALGYGQRIDSEQPGRTEPVAAIAAVSRSERWIAWPKRLFGPSRP